MWNYAKTNVSSKKPFVTETIMSLFDKGLSLTKLDRVFRISAVHQPFLHFDLYSNTAYARHVYCSIYLFI